MEFLATFPQNNAFELDDNYHNDNNLSEHSIWQTPILYNTSTIFPTTKTLDSYRWPSLLSLPLEIRRLIYGYLILADRTEQWVDILDIPPPHPARSISAYLPAPVPAPSIYGKNPLQTSRIRTKNNLLGVNEQIRNEYADAMLEHSILIIDTWTCDSLETHGSSIMKNLRKLKFKPESLNDYFMSLPTLQKCVALRHLEVELDARAFEQARMFLVGSLKTLESACAAAASNVLRLVVVMIDIVHPGAPTWFIGPPNSSRNTGNVGEELSRHRDKLLQGTVETTDEGDLIHFAPPLVLPLGVEKFVLHMAMSTSQFTYLRDDVHVPGCERSHFQGGCKELYNSYPESYKRKHCVQWLCSEQADTDRSKISNEL